MYLCTDGYLFVLGVACLCQESSPSSMPVPGIKQKSFGVVAWFLTLWAILPTQGQFY